MYYILRDLFLCTHHVDVKLIEASEWGFRDLPQGEHEADSGEGAFPTRQRPHVTHAIILPARRLYLYMHQNRSVNVPVFCFVRVLFINKIILFIIFSVFATRIPCLTSKLKCVMITNLQCFFSPFFLFALNKQSLFFFLI